MFLHLFPGLKPRNWYLGFNTCKFLLFALLLIAVLPTNIRFINLDDPGRFAATSLYITQEKKMSFHFIRSQVQYSKN
jgi:hypothetical protein